MRIATKLALAALVAAGAMSTAATTPANAAVGFSIQLYDRDYDYNRSCSYYYRNDIPAPRRCYDYFHRYYGSGLYMDGDFIFRSHNDFYRWRDRDDYRHWRRHEFRRDYWDRDRRDHRDRRDRDDHRRDRDRH
jgi:hypothetical protein